MKTLVSVSLLLLALSPACAPTVVCGEGTVKVSDECVRRRSEVSCGAGAHLDEVAGECRPDVSCGAGARYDAATLKCVPEAPCGAGTFLDEGRGYCVPELSCGEGTRYDAEARLCVALASCGEGTHLDEAVGECVPDDSCGAGTHYHPLRHVCVPDFSCGPGLIAHDDVCLSPADVLALDADAGESSPDANDPALGGVPEALTLEPIGEAVIFAGNISRPVDRDSDGDIDQDVDVWGFTGAVGQRLRVRVLDDGLPLPAFRVRGPAGYERSSRVGVVREPVRDVVLPYDGEYVVEIFPAAFLLDGSATGGPDFNYVGVIEEVGWPFVESEAPPLLPQLSTSAADPFLLDDGVRAYDVPALAPVYLSAGADDHGTEPVLLLFDGGGAFLEEIAFTRDDGRWSALTATVARASGGLTVVVDWRSSTGFSTLLQLDVALLEEEALGAVTPAAPGFGAGVVVPGRYGMALGFDAEAGDVVTVDLLGLTNGLVRVLGPLGPVDDRAQLGARQLALLARASGRYVVVALNRGVSDVELRPLVVASAPIDVGTLGPGGFTSVAATALATARRLPERLWLVVDGAADALFRFDLDYTLGMPDLAVYRVDDTGALFDRRIAREDDVATLRAERAAGELALVLVDPGALWPPNPAVRELRLDISAAGAPFADEEEPNDLDGEAAVLAALPALVVGELYDGDVDRYRLPLAAPLTANEALEIHVEDLEGARATALTVTDASGAVVAVSDHARASAVLLTANDGAAPFTLVVEGGSAGYRYALEVRRRVVSAEEEPNDTVGAATHVTFAGAPKQLFGRTTKLAPDVIAVDVAALPVGAALRLRAENLFDSRDLALSVVDENGATTASTAHEDAVLLVPASAAATVYARIEGLSSTKSESYRLVVDALGPVEREPNDDPASATVVSVPAMGATVVHGQDLRARPDHYRFELSAPLGVDEAVTVRFANALERGDLAVAILDDAGQELLAQEGYFEEMTFAPATSSFVLRVSPVGYSTDDRAELYRLDVEHVAVTAEREPNGGTAQAQALALPALVRALSRTDDVDVYRVPLAGEGMVLVARLAHRFRNDDVTLTVRGDDGAQLFSRRDAQHDVRVVAPAGATGLFVEVRSHVGDVNELASYELALSLEDGD